eukprot:TRINITY_DN2003_c0_g1_i5.p1 TRINITY_DN2003_c0_g1~~TRINITY_DN2003_c0_g1_i5.p1  ORF type:complete len:396 (+),score=105.46 TRINITY_DN2003_c0_g1_i5:58-1245(+)
MAAAEDEEIHLPEIRLEEEVFNVQFHPSQDILALATVTGAIQLWGYHADGNRQLFETTHHSQSCRALQFSDDGNFIYSGSSDCGLAIFDLAASKVCYHNPQAHTAGIYSLNKYEQLLVTGDDEGVIKVWDVRDHNLNPVFDLDEHTDYVSDLWPSPQHGLLLATGGDGVLTTWDMRTGKLQCASVQIEDELLSITVIKDNSLVVCGSQEGVLELFKWGEFGDISDRFPGHPLSIDTILKIDEDNILTGSSDGLIRVVAIHPFSLVGVLGEHEEFPIERMAFSRDKNFLASCSHDQTVKFWDARDLFVQDETEEGDDKEMEHGFPQQGDGEDEDSEEDDDEEEGEEHKHDVDMDSDDDGDDDDDDSDEEEKKGQGKKGRRSMNAKQLKKKDFFSGM